MRPTFRFIGANSTPNNSEWLGDLGTRRGQPKVDNSPDEYKPSDLQLNKNELIPPDEDDKEAYDIGDYESPVILNRPGPTTEMTSEAVEADLEPGTSTLDPQVNEYPEPIEELNWVYDPNVTNQLNNIVASPVGRLLVSAQLKLDEDSQ